MKGMNRHTGKYLSGVEHLKQSIRDILTTPVSSRLLRRTYGSSVFNLIDHPQIESFKLKLYVSIAEALNNWEPRLKLERIAINLHGEGRVEVIIIGRYIHENSLIDEFGETIEIDGVFLS